MGRIKTYIACLLCLVVFGLVVQPSTAFVFLMVWISIPLLGFIEYQIARKSVEITVTVTQKLFSKGDRIDIHVSIINKSIIPIFGLVIEYTDDEGIRYRYAQRCEIFLKPRESMEINQEAELLYWGAYDIGIEDAHISDMLGVIIHDLSMELACTESRVVVPDVMEVYGAEQLLERYSNMTYGGDIELSRHNTLAISGSPGYQMRDYIPGDSLSRINWKQSSREDKLVVREEEVYVTDKIYMMLMLGDRYLRKEAEIVIESFLGIAKQYIENGVRVFVIYKKGENWTTMEVNLPSDLRIIQVDLAYYRMKSTLKDKYLEEISKMDRGTAIITFLTISDGGAYDRLTTLEQAGYHSIFIVPPQRFKPAQKLSKPVNQIRFLNNYMQSSEQQDEDVLEKIYGDRGYSIELDGILRSIGEK